MFRLIKKAFIALLNFSISIAGEANGSNFTLCLSLNNQPCMNRPTLIDLDSDEYNQGLHYHPFTINVDRCNGSCNTLDDPSHRICVPDKTEDVSLNVFNIITRINE